MSWLLSFIGVLFYIGYVIFIWSNKVDAGDKTTFRQLIYFERQEIAVTLIGAIIFSFSGDNIIDSSCDLIEFFYPKAHNLCVNIQVNLENEVYILGGATFGTILLMIIKYSKKRAKKRLEE